jgi:hypothetical protein
VDDSNNALSLVDSSLRKLNVWCCRQLENYHAHSSENNCSIFEAMLNLVLLLPANPTEDGGEESMLIESPVGSTPESKWIHLFVVRSIQVAYKQALISSDGLSKTEFKHPLAILASELKLVAEKECTAFSPILNKYHREAQKVALIPLHLLVGQQLELCLERADRLRDSKEVLAASNIFELFITQQLNSVYRVDVRFSFSNYLMPCMIGRFSSPLFLQWLHTVSLMIRSQLKISKARSQSWRSKKSKFERSVVHKRQVRGC